MTKHIMIATPAYDGSVNIPYALSLAETYLLLKSQGIEISTRLAVGSSLLIAERNRIIQAFWDSEATHLLCIDADLGWAVQAIPAMLQEDLEFICGIYPARGENVFNYRPCLDENGDLILNKHLIKAEYVPAGFMLISRSAIEKMRNHFPELYFEPKTEERKSENGYYFFGTEVHEGEFWGEDFVFCRKAREAGVDIWIDPLIEFDHAGKRGKLVDLLSTPIER